MLSTIFQWFSENLQGASIITPSADAPADATQPPPPKLPPATAVARPMLRCVRGAVWRWQPAPVAASVPVGQLLA